MEGARKILVVVDKQQLAEYFNKLFVSYEKALNLNVADEIIVNASVLFYRSNTYEFRKKIKRILTRNSKNICSLKIK